MKGGLARIVAVGVTVAVLAAGAFLSRGLSLDEDITSLLPDTDPVISDYRDVATRFRALDTLYIDVGLEGDSTAGPEDAAAAADALYARLEGSGSFRMIHYRVSPERFLGLLDKLEGDLGSLLSEADLAALEARLAPAEIDARLAAARKALLDPSGVFLKDRIRRDPLGFDELLLARLKSLADRGTGASGEPNVSDGRIWSGDGRHILVLAQPKFRATDTVRGAELSALLDGARAEILSAAPAGVRISYLGGHRAAVDNASAIKGDVSRALGISSAGILLVGLLFMRRRAHVLLMFLPAAFGLSCASALFGVMSPSVSAVAVGIAVVLVGITVDYGIHVLFRLDSGVSADLGPYAATRPLLAPLAIGSSTTAAGLLCLLFSALPGQRQAGLFAAVSVAGAVLCAALLLPAIAGRARRSARLEPLPLVDWCARFLDWRRRRGVAFAAGALACLAVCVAGLARLRFDGDINSLNYLTPADRADERVVSSVWGDFASSAAVVGGATADEALEANDRLFAAAAALKSGGAVASVSSISAILPSGRTQAENASRWERFWSPERVARLRADMAAAAGRNGFSPAAFEPFLAALSSPPGRVAVEDFGGTGLDTLIESRVVEEEGGVFVLTAFTVPDAADFDGAAEALLSAVPSATIVSGRRFAEHAASMVGEEMGKILLLAPAAVALCLFLFFARVELAALCLVPVALSAAMTLGFLGLIGVPVNIMSLLLVVFVFGVGIDYSVFLLSEAVAAFRGAPAADAATLGSVVTCALTTMCAFASLAFARHPALFSIGLTGTVGMATSLLAAVLVMPFVASRFLPPRPRLGSATLATLSAGALAFVYLAGAGMFYVLVLRYVFLITFRGREAERQRRVRRFMHGVTRGLVRLWPAPRSRRVLADAGPERFREPAVIVSNHHAAADIILLLALPADMVMLVKPWVWRAPLIGRMVRDAGFLVTGDDFEPVAARAARLLQSGVSVTIFPEGTRSDGVSLGRFHKGAFEIAVRAGADVLPVLLTGTQAATPRGAFWIGPHNIIVRVLDRVTARGFDYSLGGRALASHVKRAMLERVASDWRLSQEGPVFLSNIARLYAYLGPSVESYVKWKVRLDPLPRRIDALVPESGAVLDLGCGFGILSNILARKSPGRRVLGVDYDERKLSAARRTVIETANVSFESADITAWDYPRADAVLLVDVLHYWPEDVQRRVIEKACRCLAPGGTLVFRDALSSAGWRHRLVHWAEKFATVSGHNRTLHGLRFRDETFYRGAFEAAGMTFARGADGAGLGSNKVLVFTKTRVLEGAPA